MNSYRSICVNSKAIVTGTLTIDNHFEGSVLVLKEARIWNSSRWHKYIKFGAGDPLKIRPMTQKIFTLP
jgi:hypothetical protein